MKTHTLTTKKLILLVVFSAFLIVVTFLWYYSQQKTEITEEPIPPNLADVIVLETVTPSLSVENFNRGTITTAPYFYLENEQEEGVILDYAPFDLSESYLGTLFETFGLTDILPISDDETLITAGNGNEYITAYLNDKYLLYENSPGIEQDASFLGDDPEKYESIARTFVEKFDLNMDNYEFTKYAYYTTHGYEASIVNSYEKAEFIEIIYEAHHASAPVIDKPGNLEPNRISVWILPDGTITKAMLEPVGDIKSAIKTVNLKNTQEVADDINNQNAILVNTKTPIGEIIVSTYAQQGALSFYRVDETLVPIYVVEGTSQTENDNKGDAYIFVNAIK